MFVSNFDTVGHNLVLYMMVKDCRNQLLPCSCVAEITIDCSCVL